MAAALVAVTRFHSGPGCFAAAVAGTAFVVLAVVVAGTAFVVLAVVVAVADTTSAVVPVSPNHHYYYH